MTTRAIKTGAPTCILDTETNPQNRREQAVKALRMMKELERKNKDRMVRVVTADAVFLTIDPDFIRCKKVEKY